MKMWPYGIDLRMGSIDFSIGVSPNSPYRYIQICSNVSPTPTFSGNLTWHCQICGHYVFRQNPNKIWFSLLGIHAADKCAVRLFGTHLHWGLYTFFCKNADICQQVTQWFICFFTPIDITPLFFPVMNIAKPTWHAEWLDMFDQPANWRFPVGTAWCAEEQYPSCTTWPPYAWKPCEGRSLGCHASSWIKELGRKIYTTSWRC